MREGDQIVAREAFAYGGQGTVELFIRHVDHDGGVSMGRMEWGVKEDWNKAMAIQPERALLLQEEASQTLMDSLWHAGVRPTDRKQTDDTVHAMAEHLDDLRTIVFRFMEIE